MNSRGVIFLSHANVDKAYVDPVKTLLDSANVFFDVSSIEAGEDTIQAMRRGISDAAVFVLFHSPATETVWVRFEQELAQFESARDRRVRILVCTLPGGSYRTLPDWMQRFMTAPADFTASDTARTIQHLHSESLRQTHPEIAVAYYGREELLRQVSLDVLTAPAKAGVALNTLVFSGLQGMGRSTLATQVIQEAFRGMRPAGPTFDLPMAAGSADWHLRFIEDLRGGLSNADKAAQREAFEALSPKQQAVTLVASLQHWAGLNQVVTVKTRWGLRDRGDRLHLWLEALLEELGKKPTIKLIMLSERRLPATELAIFPHVRQYALEELSSSAIQYILTKRIEGRFLDMNRLPSISERIHGHPATANYVAYLVNGGRSLDSLNLAPDPIYVFQSKVLNALFGGQRSV